MACSQYGVASKGRVNKLGAMNKVRCTTGPYNQHHYDAALGLSEGRAESEGPGKR